MIDKTPKKSSENLAQDAPSRSHDLLLALSRAAQSIQRARTAEEVYRAVGDQIKSLGGDVSSMVPPEVATVLRAKFNDPNRDGAGTNYVVSLQD